MKKYNENQILFIIKWAPISFIVIISIIITYLRINDNNILHKNEIVEFKKNFIQTKNNLVKNDVYAVEKYLQYSKAKSENELKMLLKEKVYRAHNIASRIYLENKDKNKEQILKLVKDALRYMRFNDNRAYFFIHNIKGYSLLYPLNKRLEGNNYALLQDINGYYFVQTIMEKVKNKTEGYDEYFWVKEKNLSSKAYKKIIFTKYFEPLDIVISTGDYIIDYENNIKIQVLKYINTLSIQKNSSLFIINEDKKILSHSNANLLNKEFNQLPLNVQNTISNISKEIPDTEGFIKYQNTFDIKNNLKDEKQTSFIKVFKPWQWTIGSGYYEKELETLIFNEKEKLKRRIDDDFLFTVKTSIFSTLAFILVSFFLSSLVSKRFIAYKNALLKEVEKSRLKDSLLAQQSKMAAMGEMLANIAHQWKQPLSVISTASSGIRLKSEFNSLEEEDLYHSLETIDNSTIYLSKTIDDFSNFFKTSKVLTRTNTKEIWKSVESLIFAQFKSQNISFVLNIEKEDVYLLNNELIQVLLNLLNNAKDQFVLNKQGGCLIFINMYVKDENLHIKVKDNAGGIDNHIISRIFEPYFTTKYRAQGTGIGLYMSEQIVTRSLKGSITATNKKYKHNEVPYEGALITIVIPTNI